MTSATTSTTEPTVEDAIAIKQPLDDAVIDPYCVTLEPKDNPQCMSSLRRWIIVCIISSIALCVTFSSSMAALTEAGTSETFHVSHEVSVLAISLYVAGLGSGPLLVGPLSEVYGRNIIYRISFTLFFIFNFPIAFAPDMGVFLFFRFLTGFCGSAFLSVAGGTVSDMFPNSTVATPMAFYTMSPFLGPIAGPLVSGFIVQNVYWRWMYRVMLCWIFTEVVLLFLLVPETYVPVILQNKAARLRKATGDTKYYAPLDKVEVSLAKSIIVSCYRPFQLMLFDQMILLLNIWTALLLGILYLAFQAYPIIFQRVHHFNTQMTGLTFLGLGVGNFVAIATQPFWNKFFAREAAKYSGNPPPEARLIMGQVGAVLVPISLFWLAFTTYPQVHWIAPIIASVPFGSGVYFVFTSTFTYLVTAYRPVAASAMASNTALRCGFAIAFPLFAGAMYDRLGTVGATALLAGLTTIIAPLPFVFYRIGERLRKRSKFAAH